MTLSGGVFDYIAVFFAGVLVSFTPCVYPLIPISVGCISAKSGKSKVKSFILSLVYVTGVAITYSILGIIVSLTGIFFGKISTSPVTYIVVGLLIIVFGALMWLDLLSIPWIGTKIDARKRGYISTFVLGLGSGLIVSPCLTPMLGSILAYISTKKNILYGVSLLMTFAYGMGIILILAGTSSSILIHLPKSGKWMVYIKQIASIVLILIGIYFIYNGIRSL
jgi:thiol:disulfide interchange protein DsbD